MGRWDKRIEELDRLEALKERQPSVLSEETAEQEEDEQQESSDDEKKAVGFDVDGDGTIEVNEGAEEKPHERMHKGR